MMHFVSSLSRFDDRFLLSFHSLPTSTAQHSTLKVHPPPSTMMLCGLYILRCPNRSIVRNIRGIALMNAFENRKWGNRFDRQS